MSGHSPTAAAGIGIPLCRLVTRAFDSTPLRHLALRTQSTPRFDSNTAYVEDRVGQVGEYAELFAPFASFHGKVVAELGCSRGYLLRAFREREEFTAIGIDADPIALRLAAKAYPEMRFERSTAASIPLPDASVDVVYTIDTVEHLSRPEEMFLEMHRILRPGGVCLVHFNPWLGPYGSHLEDVIPMPWPHVFFSMDTLLAVAARRYDSPDHQPAAYWFDPETGRRRPNPFLDRERWAEFLNHMTVGGFRRLARRLPFRIVHFESLGFGGRRFRLAKYAGRLSSVPFLGEFFTKAVFCVLSKDAS